MPKIINYAYYTSKELAHRLCKKTKDVNGKNLHDTQKPVELMSILIQNSSKPGELVVDPFAGIFTTAVACKQLKRRFIGSEIDPTYYNLGVDFVRGVIK